MLIFPEATKVNRRIPKESFYKHLQMNSTLKDHFISDVDRINVENSLTNDSLNLSANSEIKEILVLSILLKRKEYDDKIIEAIARQNPHKLLFSITCDGEQQLAIYKRKLYRTNWDNAEKTTLEVRGFSLDEIWDCIAEQIALSEERIQTIHAMSLEERLALQEQIMKIEKNIAKIEAAAWKEQQPKKRFELYTRLKQYKDQLEELKHGQN